MALTERLEVGTEMKITEIKLHYFYVPYKAPVAPYWGAVAPCYGAHGILVEMRTDQGLVGWGETAGREATEKHSDCAALMMGRDPLQINLNCQYLKTQGCSAIAISGVEMAMWDLLGKSSNCSIAQLLGGAQKSEVELCGLMGVKSPEEAVETAQQYIDLYGFQTIKTKAGRDFDEDVAIITQLRKALGTEMKVRADANQSYSFEHARALSIGAYAECGIEYFEQPMAKQELELHSLLRTQGDSPIGLNESVTNADSVAKIVGQQAADFLVVDIPDAGGISELVKLVQVADAFNLPCAFHCWHDFGVKTAVMAQLCAALPGLSVASDTLYFGLENDVIAQPHKIQEGKIPVPDAPGVGVEIDMDMVNRYRKAEID